MAQNKRTMSSVKEFLLIGIVAILLIATSCHNESSDNKAIYDTDSTKTTVESVRKAKSIFYQMYLPSEMYKIFEKAGAVYNPDILNPVENVNLYETSAKAA